MARESHGGGIVRRSLDVVGARPGNRVSLVETATNRRLEVVLVQSAWNVIDQKTFRRLLRPYPPRMRARAVARRAVTAANLRRAERVVCLTSAVGDLCRSHVGIDPIVAPVTAALCDWRERLAVTPGGSYALVVGTVTWFKRPETALIELRRRRPDVRHVLFVGGDDGSGCWANVMLTASRLGMKVERRTVPHGEMYDLYRDAALTLLPSALESLGFALSEALLHAGEVVASPLPSHVEVANRVGGREPQWIGGGPIKNGDRAWITREEVEREWLAVKEALGA